ncbi:hypothetical protein [Wenjunlia tyrosinilytica]|uniref:Uncharacterized protein n=1 Tax=Wenjunlia tyrosinilytica TaxID=1544741 RepID=A0A917ZXB1_9ACTN|nr:hypothetical protein [Wenjunlia tyrosinilytica]GGO98147.1 hypothetical protein GCM10012280_61600 [Wenjunlia tyrosinilytica]
MAASFNDVQRALGNGVKALHGDTLVIERGNVRHCARRFGSEWVFVLEYSDNSRQSQTGTSRSNNAAEVVAAFKRANRF